MPRLFVALDLPEWLREQLSTLTCGLPGAKWVKPEQMHLTLRFIGEVDGMQFKRIGDALADIKAEPFSLKLEGIGFFPPRKKPKVVWVGLAQNEELIRLRNRIESTLVRNGLEPEGRKFSPHITLARLKDTPRNKIGDYLAINSLFSAKSFTVNEFVLYSSVLNSKGAKHYIEEIYSLE